MASLTGVTLAKIDGKFWVYVTNANWDVKQDVASVKTGGGIKNAVGLIVSSGSVEEMVPIAGPLDISQLKSFSVQIYDQVTQKILIYSATNCDWDDASGSSTVEGPKTSRKVGWKAENTLKW
jgi:hypothetical protein